jgi:hypothetical protein
MAKTFDDGRIPLPFKADVNLSSYQYYCVTLTASAADYVELATAASDPTPIGVLQDNTGTSQGQPVSVVVMGPTKAYVSACDIDGNACPIQPGDALVCGSDGTLFRAGSKGYFYNARAFGAISTACNLEVIPVMFYGGMAACAMAAS